MTLRNVFSTSSGCGDPGLMSSQIPTTSKQAVAHDVT